jgi:serine/threonine protein kinase
VEEVWAENATPFGRYQLLELLGAGGMGQVFRAHDTVTQRVVALKVLPPQMATDPGSQHRFRREAFAAAQLNDPHVVPIHNFGEIDRRLYVDMRLIEGRDLGSVPCDDDRLQPARAVSIIEQVASARDAAHHVGLVHRDVKLSNIFVGTRDFVYLIDFGIARAAEDTRLTGAGETLGTLAYMAPERFTIGQVDPRSDVYSLTCVLFDCLTGRQPFLSESPEQKMASHTLAPPAHPSDLVPGLPRAFGRQSGFQHSEFDCRNAWPNRSTPPHQSAPPSRISTR